MSIIDPNAYESLSLSSDEKTRYARHITIPDVGLEGQKKLRAAKVLCIGAGGLGSPVTMYLAAAGVGQIGIVDFDVVDTSNLQRQILHGASDVGRKKIDSARDALAEINPEVKVVTYDERLTAENAERIAEPYDVIIDGTDNFPTRYLSNDLAVLTKKPNVYGSIYRFEGQVSVFAPHLGSPCYRCLFPEPPEPGQVPSCAEGGVLGVLPGIIGSLQANEAIKLILGIGDSLLNRLVHFDALRFRFREIKLRRDSQCKICGDTPSIVRLQEIEFECQAPEPTTTDMTEITVQDLKARLNQPESFVLLDVREPAEVEVAKIEGSTLIPLGELPQRYTELDADAEIIIHCKVGGRSAQALRFLNEQGFKNASHVIGGINEWSRAIDPSVALY
ncbi:MAG: molybdopterin-synthase adenylyltransferase MoeB [Verrucomicrobiota bacterium]